MCLSFVVFRVDLMVNPKPPLISRQYEDEVKASKEGSGGDKAPTV